MSFIIFYVAAPMGVAIKSAIKSLKKVFFYLSFILVALK